MILHKSKYKSVKINGYHSKKEYKRALILAMMESKGLISGLQEQVSFELLPKQEVLDFNGKTICGRRAMKYIADFVYEENGNRVVEDVKGMRTAVYRQKANLMKKIFNITIKES